MADCETEHVLTQIAEDVMGGHFDVADYIYSHYPASLKNLSRFTIWKCAPIYLKCVQTLNLPTSVQSYLLNFELT